MGVPRVPCLSKSEAIRYKQQCFSLRARGGGSEKINPKFFGGRIFWRGGLQSLCACVTGLFLLKKPATPPRAVALRPCEAPSIRFSPTSHAAHTQDTAP